MALSSKPAAHWRLAFIGSYGGNKLGSMHLPHNAKENFARLRILFVPTTTNIFLFSSPFRLDYGVMVTGNMRSLATKMVRSCLSRVGVPTHFITPYSP